MSTTVFNLPVAVDQSSTTTFRLGHRPVFDGLRGISILLVLLVHLPMIAPGTLLFMQGGFLGVDVFFVLSGFLITSLLLSEHERTNTLSLRNFYIRRALRLAPALITVILFSCLVGTIVGFSDIGLTPIRLLSTLGYFTNWVRAYEMGNIWFLAHSWSLSVEEQFYLVWPVTLSLLLYFKIRRTSITVFTVGLILVSALLKVVFSASGVNAHRITYGSDTHADTILIGCLVALCLHWSYIPAFLRNRSPVLMRSAIGIMVTFVIFTQDGTPILYRGGYTIFAVSTGMVVLHLMQHPDSRLSIPLSSPALIWIGKRAYGIYLWHWPIFQVVSWLTDTLVAPLAIALTFIVAGLSYRFVELPFLQLKDKYARA